MSDNLKIKLDNVSKVAITIIGLLLILLNYNEERKIMFLTALFFIICLIREFLKKDIMSFFKKPLEINVLLIPITLSIYKPIIKLLLNKTQSLDIVNIFIVIGVLVVVYIIYLVIVPEIIMKLKSKFNKKIVLGCIDSIVPIIFNVIMISLSGVMLGYIIKNNDMYIIKNTITQFFENYISGFLVKFSFIYIFYVAFSYVMINGKLIKEKKSDQFIKILGKAFIILVMITPIINFFNKEIALYTFNPIIICFIYSSKFGFLI